MLLLALEPVQGQGQEQEHPWASQHARRSLTVQRKTRLTLTMRLVLLLLLLLLLPLLLPVLLLLLLLSSSSLLTMLLSSLSPQTLH